MEEAIRKTKQRFQNAETIAKKDFKKGKKSARRRLSHGEKRAVHISRYLTNRKRYGRFLRILGPGVITGAADDDPSGIATYSQAGAQFGMGLLWAFPLMFPLLLAVQECCARIGAVTGKGLAAILKENYSRKLLYTSVALVVVANTVNIGADFGALASTTQLLVPVNFAVLAVGFAVVITMLEIFVPYKRYASFLKWLALSLLAYPITAFMIHQNWHNIAAQTFTLHPKLNMATMYILVGMIGTTISPYLFFWDTSEVVENEIISHRLAETKSTAPRINRHFIRSVRVDNFVGMAITVVTAWFIVIVCGSVLFAHGVKNINTAADAARALQPLVQSFPNAGLVAKIIFSVGIIGIGLLAIPVLAGSASYAISETLGWKEGLHHKFRRATGFYVVIIISTLLGVGMNFLGIDPIKALVFAAVFNGISAVPLLLMIAKVGSNRTIMGEYKNGWASNLGIYTAFAIMLAAALVMFYAFATGNA